MAERGKTTPPPDWEQGNGTSGGEGAGYAGQVGRRPHGDRATPGYSCPYESIIDFSGAAPVVRWRRFLLWRPGVWRRRARPGSADLPGHLFHGWISHEGVTTAPAFRGLKPAVGWRTSASSPRPSPPLKHGGEGEDAVVARFHTIPSSRQSTGSAASFLRVPIHLGGLRSWKKHGGRTDAPGRFGGWTAKSGGGPPHSRTRGRTGQCASCFAATGCAASCLETN